MHYNANAQNKMKTPAVRVTHCRQTFTSRQWAPPAEQPPNTNHQLQAASLSSGCPLRAGRGTAASCCLWWEWTWLCRRANTRRREGARCLKVGQPILKILSRGPALLCFHLSLWCLFLSSYSLSLESELSTIKNDMFTSQSSGYGWLFAPFFF